MNTAPEFAAYPVAPAPVYSRWLAWAVALLVLSGSAGVALGSFIEPRTAVVGGALAVLVWLLALLLRVFTCHCNPHNALCYAEVAQQAGEVWWRHHGRRSRWSSLYCLGATCSTSQHRAPAVESRTISLPHRLKTDEGQTLRLGAGVFLGKRSPNVERNLAILLALQWQRAAH